MIRAIFSLSVVVTLLVVSGGISIAQAATDALDEVNATRAQRGLRPFVRDNGLSIAAAAAADVRAQYLCKGHTANDFSYVPAGTVATSSGCTAWTDDWGWGSCCTYENFTYAGAAWTRGSDGKRYMHLYVR